jgi:hypothetical protein
VPADTRKKMSGWFWFALYFSLRPSIFPDTRQPCPDCACSESLDEGSIAPRTSDDAWPATGGKEGEKGGNRPRQGPVSVVTVLIPCPCTPRPIYELLVEELPRRLLRCHSSSFPPFQNMYIYTVRKRAFCASHRLTAATPLKAPKTFTATCRREHRLASARMAERARREKKSRVNTSALDALENAKVSGGGRSKQLQVRFPCSSPAWGPARPLFCRRGTYCSIPVEAGGVFTRPIMWRHPASLVGFR